MSIIGTAAERRNHWKRIAQSREIARKLAEGPVEGTMRELDAVRRIRGYFGLLEANIEQALGMGKDAFQ